MAQQPWYFWTAAAATAAFSVGAVVAGVAANGRYSDLENGCAMMSEGCSESQIDTVKSRARLATALWILAGASAVATGVTFYIDSRESGVSVALRFWAMRRRAIVCLLLAGCSYDYARLRKEDGGTAGAAGATMERPVRVAEAQGLQGPRRAVPGRAEPRGRAAGAGAATGGNRRPCRQPGRPWWHRRSDGRVVWVGGGNTAGG